MRRCSVALAGFSLLELLLAIALVALLWTVGSSGWQTLQRRARRDQACLLLLQLAAREQEWWAWHGRYTSEPMQLGCAASGCATDAGADPGYRVHIEAGAHGQAFTLRALPGAGQRSDRCGVLELDQLGAWHGSAGGQRCCGTALH